MTYLNGKIVDRSFSTNSYTVLNIFLYRISVSESQWHTPTQKYTEYPPLKLICQPGGGGVLPYMTYTGKGMVFGLFVLNRVYNLT